MPGFASRRAGSFCSAKGGSSSAFVRNIAKQRVQTFRHCRMSENGVSERRIGKARGHRRLHDCHDLASLRAYHGEAEDMIVGIDKRLHEAGRFRRRPRSQDGRHWQLGHTRSEEHTSELQSLMRISYAVFCLKKKKT